MGLLKVSISGVRQILTTTTVKMQRTAHEMTVPLISNPYFVTIAATENAHSMLHISQPGEAMARAAMASPEISGSVKVKVLIYRGALIFRHQHEYFIVRPARLPASKPIWILIPARTTLSS